MTSSERPGSGASDSRPQLAVLVVIVSIGGLVLAGERLPLVRKLTEGFFSGLEILLALVFVVLIAGGWYVRRKHPELAATADARARERGPNPFRRDLVISFFVMLAGSLPLALALPHALRTEDATRAWIYLGIAAVCFAGALLVALPRLRRFAGHAADEIAADLTAAPPEAPARHGSD